ncbi:ISAs1 family transposase [Methylosinus sp. LW4]|uniref:ISAs1 family transposase n=1 Tax=Methylosinus sp. LW4 TaxID=136993 RepID=UPI0009FF1945
MGSNPNRRLPRDDDRSCILPCRHPRSATRRRKIYNQVGVILFSILAMLSGARSYRQIHALIRARLSLLNSAFPDTALHRVPAYTSVRGILRQLDPNELEKSFRRHAESLDSSCADAPSRFIAIDGKTLRQSFDAFADRKAAHVLSAFGVNHQIILAQCRHRREIERDNRRAGAGRRHGLERARLHARRHALPKKPSRSPKRPAMISSCKSKVISRACCNTANTSPQQRLQSPRPTAGIWRGIVRRTGASRSTCGLNEPATREERRGC